jgi:hypothetical protein
MAMRVIPVLLCLAVLTLAAEDLTPRTAGGWNGFKRGSWAKLKRTYIPEGRNAQVTIWKTTLTKVGKDTLTTETVVTNVVGMKQESTATVPREGEAGKGEKESAAKLENETLTVEGKKLDCARVRTTVTGPTGKRVIEEWTAAEPRVRVKRAETYYDVAGKVTMTRTLLLVSLKEVREVGEHKVQCQKYKLVTKLGETVDRATAYTSRDVPGDMVRLDGKQTRDGLPVAEYRFEVLAFETK